MIKGRCLAILLISFIVISEIVNCTQTTLLQVQRPSSNIRPGIAQYTTASTATLPAFAHGAECPPSSGIMGKDVSNSAPDFFRQILSNVGVQYSDFAYNALVHWANQENTAAYWNPLATTWNMGSKSCLFDSSSAGVQNYADEDTGITATANTLRYSYGFYQPIMDMLNLKAFDDQKLKAALRHCIGYSAYEDRLVQYWHDTYPIPAAVAGALNGNKGSTANTGTQQPSSQVTLTLYVHDGSVSGPLIPGAIVTGQFGTDYNTTLTANSNGYVTITGYPGIWYFNSYASGYEFKDWSQSITEDSTKHAFLAKHYSTAPQAQVYTPANNNTSSYKPVSQSYSPANNVVGKWDLNFDWGCDGSHHNSQIIFNNDGTFSQIVFNDDGTFHTQGTGKWILNGNKLHWTYDTGPAVYDWIVQMNTMSGDMNGFGAYPFTRGCWKAIRVDTGN